MARVLGAGGANGASDAAKHELLKFSTVCLSHRVALCADAEEVENGPRYPRYAPYDPELE